MNQAELKIKEQLGQQLSYKIKIATAVVLIILLVVMAISKVIGLFFPKIKTNADILNDITSSEYVAFGALDCKDHVVTLANPDAESILINKGIDKNNWDNANRWIKDVIAKKYLDASSMDKANEMLSKFVEASLPTTCIALKTTSDGNGNYPVSKEIIESNVPAIQVFDMYIPINTSVALEDLTEVMLESKANIKLVEVKTKERGTEDPSYSSIYENIRYIVYTDTPEELYEEDYIIKLRIDQFGLAKNSDALVTYISRVDSVNEDFANLIYLTGGSSIEKASIFTKLKFALPCFIKYILGWLSSVRLLSKALLLFLVGMIMLIGFTCFFFPPATIVIVLAYQLLIVLFYIICTVISLICELLRKIFRKPSLT